MKNRLFRVLFFGIMIAAITCSSCSINRTLPEEAFLYKKSKFKITKAQKDIATASLNSEYKTLLKTPRPNKRFLGIRWKLRFYNLFHTKKQKGLWHWFQEKLGEPPVIYEEQTTSQTERVLENKAFNNGFFDVTVTSQVKKKRKRTKVKYSVHIEEPFLIHSIKNSVSDSLIKSRIEQIQKNSILKTNQPYNLAILKKERERITTALRQEGFYFFSADFLKFKADTTKEKRKIYLQLALKEQVDSAKLKPQFIHQILVFPNVHLKENKKLVKDTINYEGIQIISDETLLKPSVLQDAITFQKEQTYSLETHRATLERLSFLQNYQFIDVQFVQKKETDSLLNVVIRLTPRKREAIEGSLGLSLKSGLYLGPEISLTYLNRNIFKGAEQLKLTAFGNYNYPLVPDIASLQEQGLSMEVSKPGLLIPFKDKIWSDRLLAKSKATFTWSSKKIRLPLKGLRDSLESAGLTQLLDRLNADSTFAPFVAFNNYDFNLTYQWRKRIDIQHEFTPINIALQFPRYENPELRSLLLLSGLTNSSFEGLLLNLEKMLIIKPSYTYLYDSRLKRVKKNNYFYRWKVALSGNQLLSNNTLISKDLLESQFFQLEQDFRYFKRFSARQTIAFHLAFNVSIPFRNEVILPFFDLYSIGGPTSVRAFQPRLVGPGSVEPNEEIFFFTGTGDILIESSLEWRPKITNLIELGIFIDAGNVWLFKGGAVQDDLATFQINSFYEQLALGTGLGFRFDFDILLLRFDFAFPLTKPWLPIGERWVGNKIALGNPTWRKDNLTFNLAFGYSF